MPCTPTKLPNGMAAIVCTRGVRPIRCSCGRRGNLVCDWPLEDGKTCDKPICKACARHVGPDTDYCPFHRGDPPMTEEQKKAAGEAAANEAAKILGVKR